MEFRKAKIVEGGVVEEMGFEKDGIVLGSDTEPDLKKSHGLSFMT
jgi:hypothetical protein